MDKLQQNMSKRARKTLIHDRLMAKDEKAYSIVCSGFLGQINVKLCLGQTNRDDGQKTLGGNPSPDVWYLGS